MSGPVTPADTTTAPDRGTPERCDVEVLDGRDAEVGGFAVRRVLPRRTRRTVGPWCFVDLMGPADVGDRGLDVGPHPHIGLQTVTWLLDGAVLHRDSLGSEQLIRPGQLNLMTAGRGVSHAEETTGIHRGRLHGVQLWVAQPSSTRHGDPAFEHHEHLPQVKLDGGSATVLVGGLAGARSAARRDTDHVGVDLRLRPGRTAVPLQPSHEYAVVPIDAPVGVGAATIGPGQLGYLGLGREEVVLAGDGPARALLLGGVPFEEPLLMWWNYVARTRDEIADAHADWSAGGERFGRVASPLPRIEAPGPPWAAATS